MNKDKIHSAEFLFLEESLLFWYMYIKKGTREKRRDLRYEKLAVQLD